MQNEGSPKAQSDFGPLDRALAGSSVLWRSPGRRTNIRRQGAIRRVLAMHPELITARSACRLCRVDVKMVCRWIDGGLWPFPSRVCRSEFLFERAAVERWIVTGEWPQDCVFRDPQVEILPDD